jgi:hypothetical protein
MELTIWIGGTALAASATFFLGWWLGRRRQTEQMESLRRQVRDAYTNVHMLANALRHQYGAILRTFMEQAVNTMREHRSEP